MIKSIRSFDKTKIVYHIHKNTSNWVLLLHGIDSSSNLWKKELGILINSGFSVIAPDLRGHGQSGKPDNKKAYVLENFVKDIHCILKKEKIQNITPIGFSFGGVISILYYKFFQKKINSIVLVNTDYKLPLKVYLTYKFISLFNRSNRAIPYCIDNLDKYSRNNREENLSLLSSIKVPVLFIKATKDHVIPQKDMEAMCHQIKNVELTSIKGAHHNLWLKNIEEVNTSILKFLKKQFTPKPAASTILGIILVSLIVGILPALNSSDGITGAVVAGQLMLSSLNLGIFLFTSIITALLLTFILHIFRKD